MKKTVFWEPETSLFSVSDLKPQLASWDKATHPAQLRLQSYLDALMSSLPPLPADARPLYLHLGIAVEHPAHLLKHHDLENYLTPLFGARRLDSSRFVLVTARKFVGGTSRLDVGTAQPREEGLPDPEWGRFTYVAHGSTQTRQWKENLRTALAETNPRIIASAAAEVQIAWTCSTRRNWVSLWKPTGDCMGPILGEANPLRPFSPNDDRIVDLQLHRTLDITMANAVGIEMRWQGSGRN